MGSPSRTGERLPWKLAGRRESTVAHDQSRRSALEHSVRGACPLYYHVQFMITVATMKLVLFYSPNTTSVSNC